MGARVGSALTCKSERVLRGPVLILIDFLSQGRRMHEKLGNGPVIKFSVLMLLKAGFEA
ncbi:Hypothetical protein PMT_2627 [Prochlorococcus marinus str. MIT 9313]|uniref:Uncharacterized protein n=1 Tax=Prochlorococcus marinus (strain MIT 9313) TaxID=74547 RepID=B9ES14_PROMM|nr:Hypothetical protein PMT_2627 [Prochlorococcus marinus str. MIT 9313]